MRKILTLENGQKRARIYKQDEEYIVRFYEHAVYQSEADYFTDDLADALGTAEITIGLRRVIA